MPSQWPRNLTSSCVYPLLPLPFYLVVPVVEHQTNQISRQPEWICSVQIRSLVTYSDSYSGLFLWGMPICLVGGEHDYSEYPSSTKVERHAMAIVTTYVATAQTAVWFVFAGVAHNERQIRVSSNQLQLI
ncbi:hypothetical protein BDP27DRAFT_1414529 [Rhodocollybia butyracea]|uniref:Uncharacterized protein n=1 Tax=Rhodocollybia butyracea TaxID=206335 RepID=A0A9P5Q8N0_9AGAR|nr:hypothetical protein BDP27DRAFT_1414529 [Rhodocollybia butyracea]